MHRPATKVVPVLVGREILANQRCRIMVFASVWNRFIYTILLALVLESGPLIAVVHIVFFACVKYDMGEECGKLPLTCFFLRLKIWPLSIISKLTAERWKLSNGGQESLISIMIIQRKKKIPVLFGQQLIYKLNIAV